MHVINSFHTSTVLDGARNIIIAKELDAKPTTKRKACDIKAKNEIANQSVLEIDDLKNQNRLWE